MSLSSEEQFRRDTATKVLCAMLSNHQYTNASIIDSGVVISDMAILQAETFIARLKMCRHKNLGKVQEENLDGSKTCPDCNACLK